MKRTVLALVSFAMVSTAAVAQYDRGSSRDNDRRSDRYVDTPQFTERPGDPDRYGTTPGKPNPYATTPGSPNNWAPTPGSPPASVRNNDWRGSDYQGDRGRDRPGSASSGSTVKAAPNPNSANLLPEERRFGSGDGGGRPRR